MLYRADGDESIIGRDVIWYDWCCGYSVKVAFKACGDIIVTSYGR